MYHRPTAKERFSKADHIYLTLKQSIIDGALPPGAIIDKEELCSRLNASRSPVTIAINRLAYEGLVRVEPQRGSFVAPISLDEITQLMMLRRALEADGAAQAARRGGPEMWAMLDRNLVYQKAAIAMADYPRFYELDVEFHHAIIAASGWSKFNEVLADAHSHLDRARRVIMPIPGHLEATLDEHRAIFDALESGASELAAFNMRRHIDRVARQFQSFAAHRPELFSGVPASGDATEARDGERLSASDSRPGQQGDKDVRALHLAQ